jgi:amino acid permease
MIKNLKPILKSVISLVMISTASLFAQNADTTTTLNQLPETGKGLLYQDGKIYLVVLVLLTIFAGIVFYLIRLDKKITKLENEI